MRTAVARLIDAIGSGIFFFGIFLRGKRNDAIALSDTVDQFKRRCPRNQEWMNLAGENYDPAQRKYRQVIRYLNPAKILFNVELLLTLGLI